MQPTKPNRLSSFQPYIINKLSLFKRKFFNKHKKPQPATKEKKIANAISTHYAVRS